MNDYSPVSSSELNRLHADLCSAFSDPHRIAIIYTLAKGTTSVNELSQMLSMSQPATSRHLKVLRERGLVNATRDGITMLYQLSDQCLVEVLDLVMAILRDRITYRKSLLEQEPGEG